MHSVYHNLNGFSTRWRQEEVLLTGHFGHYLRRSESRLPTHHHKRRQVIDLRLQHWTGLEVGARAAAQQRAGARNAPSLERRLGRHFQYSLLGRPEQSDHWRDLLAVPAVRHPAGAADVRRLRAGGVRVSMTERAAG